ncbi:MAG: ATP-binding cassette domain-containing protein [Halovenus sp.]
MDLTTLLTRPGTDLSRGQKQRVTIARCLLPDPSVIFLDEPTTGLDPRVADALRHSLADLADEGRTLVYSTHNHYEAEMLADQLTIIRDGRIVTQGPKAALMDRLQGGGATGVRLSCDATKDDFEALGVQARVEAGEWFVDLPPIVRSRISSGTWSVVTSQFVRSGRRKRQSTTTR